MDSVYDVWTSPYGFLHSEIRGSMDICSSPRLIAAYHVLRRLPVPRHSPCALLSLTMRYITYPSSELVMRESLLLHSTNIVVYPNITIHGFYITLSHSQFSLFNFQGAFLPTVPAKMGSFYGIEGMVGTSGFEPPTSRLSGVRSNHLSYAPI